MSTVGGHLAVRLKHYAGLVTGCQGSNGDGFEVVVGTDGSLSVTADELARHGVRPGAHLRLVQVPQPRTPRNRMRGALAERVDPEALDAFEAALYDSKAERIAAAERRWA
jgi:hypothetical protein